MLNWHLFVLFVDAVRLSHFYFLSLIPHEERHCYGCVFSTVTWKAIAIQVAKELRALLQCDVFSVIYLAKPRKILARVSWDINTKICACALAKYTKKEKKVVAGVLRCEWSCIAELNSTSCNAFRNRKSCKTDPVTLCNSSATCQAVAFARQVAGKIVQCKSALSYVGWNGCNINKNLRQCYIIIKLSVLNGKKQVCKVLWR